MSDEPKYSDGVGLPHFYDHDDWDLLWFNEVSPYDSNKYGPDYVATETRAFELLKHVHALLGLGFYDDCEKCKESPLP